MRLSFVCVKAVVYGMYFYFLCFQLIGLGRVLVLWLKQDSLDTKRKKGKDCRESEEANPTRAVLVLCSGASRCACFACLLASASRETLARVFLLYMYTPIVIHV